MRKAWFHKYLRNRNNIQNKKIRDKQILKFAHNQL